MARGSYSGASRGLGTRSHAGRAGAPCAGRSAVLYTNDGAVHKGRQAVIQALAGRRDEIARRVPGAEVHFTASATEGEVLGDTVYELGNYAIGAPGGRPVMHGAYVIFGKRVGEAWKITRHLNTGHLPAPTEAKKLAGVA
ncbi:MAG: hypothetical protein P8Y02_02205 [Deinococcales bacterium]